MPILNKRQTELLNIIRSDVSVYVSDLFPHFKVSEATIRKDLSLLQEMNLIQRTHGEVHCIYDSMDVAPVEFRSHQNIHAKQAIARIAVSMVHEGDSIILDSGSTTLEIARLLTSMTDLRVVTNSIPIATALAKSRVEVLMPGGMLMGENLSLQGPDTDHFFNEIQADIAFLAASGVRPTIGLSSQNALECSLKQSMMQACRRRCAVVDSSKFMRSGLYLYAHFEDFDSLISDRRVEDATIDALVKRGRFSYITPEDVSVSNGDALPFTGT